MASEYCLLHGVEVETISCMPFGRSRYSRQGRVLHAYFDGEILHIRRSNYLDFMEKNMDNIKLYLRWMMSEPIDDTILKGSTDKDSAQGVLQWSVVQGLYRIFLKACLTRKKPGQMR
jgi:hypothetical protein